MDAVVGRAWPEGLTRIPYWVYSDPDVLALEQKRIFEGPVWNFLCLETELPNVGDYRTTFVGSMPVVVVRAEDGDIATFENRCAHRGALICLEDSGNAKDFQCVYHSWRYDLRGNLRSIAFARGFNGKVWLDQLGKPSTEALHVTMRFHRRDVGHLDIQLTIDDPKAYTHPWGVSLTASLLPDAELMEFICLENERDTRKK